MQTHIIQSNKMKRTFLSILWAVSATLMAAAQCGQPNTSFKEGEKLKFDLFFNWSFVWVKVGTAQWDITKTTYNNAPAYRTHLITSTNKRADKFFIMRDTLTSYTDLNVTPLYYMKRAHEGKQYRVDEVKYNYSSGKCTVSMNYNKNNEGNNRSTFSSAECAYDMISMMLRARSYDPKDWKPGTRQSFIMADGRKCERQSIVYRGKKNHKVDKTGVTYRCLVFSFMEKEDGKEKEIVKFYITDDANHLPIRLDMNLNFGTAKAFLTSAEGVRHPQTSIVKK